MFGLFGKGAGGVRQAAGEQPAGDADSWPKSAIYRSRSVVLDSQAHDHAEWLKTQRAIQRKKAGVDVEDSPYLPNNKSMVTTNRSSGLGGVVFGAVLAVTGIVAGASAMYWRLNPTPEPVEWNQEEQLLQPDGTWKPTGKVTPRAVRTMPNGTVQTRQPDGSWK